MTQTMRKAGERVVATKTPRLGANLFGNPANTIVEGDAGEVIFATSESTAVAFDRVKDKDIMVLCYHDEIETA